MIQQDQVTTLDGSRTHDKTTCSERVQADLCIFTGEMC